MEVAFENVYILIHEGEIPSKKELLPLLAQITKSGKPLLIIAEDVGDEAQRISIDKSNMLVVGERFRTKASPQQ
jgi:chaperonin GroEL (HSP60 family)